MEISEIISISGQGGLFKVVAKTKTGLIVESMKEKKRMPVYASQKISALEDISIFGTTEDMPLSEIFRKIYEKEKGGKALDAKSDNNDLKTYFEAIFPDFDDSRVYASDIKKVFLWYNTLHEMDLLKPVETKEVPNKKEKTEKNTENADAEKPKKAKAVVKTSATKSAAKTATAPKASSKAKGGKTSTVRKTGA
jgi:hypothetical protein